MKRLGKHFALMIRREINARAPCLPYQPLIREIIHQGFLAKASQIHVDAFHETLLIRFRIKEIFHEIATVRPVRYHLFRTSFNELSGVDFPSTGTIQTGFMVHNEDGENIEVKTYVQPIIRGAKFIFVLPTEESRLPESQYLMEISDLTQKAQGLKMAALGLDASVWNQFRQMFWRRKGMVLVCTDSISLASHLTLILHALIHSVSLKTLSAELSLQQALTWGRSEDEATIHKWSDHAASLSELNLEPDSLLVVDLSDPSLVSLARKAASERLVLAYCSLENFKEREKLLLVQEDDHFEGVNQFFAILKPKTVTILCPFCKEECGILHQALVERLGMGGSVLRSIPVFNRKGCEVCGYAGFVRQELLSELKLFSVGGAFEKVSEPNHENKEFSVLSARFVGWIQHGDISFEDIMNVIKSFDSSYG